MRRSGKKYLAVSPVRFSENRLYWDEQNIFARRRLNFMSKVANKLTSRLIVSGVYNCKINNVYNVCVYVWMNSNFHTLLLRSKQGILQRV